MEWYASIRYAGRRGAGETGAEPNFCFCWYDHTDTRHRVGLGLSNTTETGVYCGNRTLFALICSMPPRPETVLFSPQKTAPRLTAQQRRWLELANTRRYLSFVFDYVPATDTSSPGTAGSSMSASITDGTTTWSATLSPLPNAPWFFDGFSLDSFGVIIRTTSGTVQKRRVQF